MIVAGGEREGNDPALISHGLVARFTPDGKPDTTFSPGGPDGSALVRLTFGHGLFSEEIRSLLVQRDGRIVIAGVRPRGTQNVYYDAVLVRLTKSGDLDRSFGIGGMTIAGDGRGYTDLAEAPDGKIIALSPPTLLKIARFNADGLPDTTFGDQGVTTTEFSPESEGSNGMQTRILFQPDGRIVVVGQGREDVLLARYLAGPSHSGGVEMAVRDGILRITGTAGDDLIRLQLSDGDITVSGNLLRIPVESFSRIEIDALGGNDTLDASASPVPVILNGGEGNDILLGGAYADLLSGNAGNDTLFGGRGNDTLHGNDGNDYLSGGPGADQVFGDSGNDQIFALDLAIDTIDGGTGFDRAKGDAADLLSHVEALLA